MGWRHRRDGARADVRPVTQHGLISVCSLAMVLSPNVCQGAFVWRYADENRYGAMCAAIAYPYWTYGAG